MNRRQKLELYSGIKAILAVTLIVALVFGTAYLQWWRCGEMFPHAQLACFIGGSK